MARPGFGGWWLAAILIAACGGPADESAEPEATESEARAAARYDVRGEVMSVPRPGEAAPGVFSIRHEAIDDFVGVDGEVWGMDAMTMPFAVSEEVSLDGVAPGDKVRFTLVVDFFGDVPSQITSLEVLPPETVLEFRKAQTSGSAP